MKHVTWFVTRNNGCKMPCMDGKVALDLFLLEISRGHIGDEISVWQEKDGKVVNSTKTSVVVSVSGAWGEGL